MKKRNSGITLIEMLLVFAIIASIFLLSLRQYQIYRNDADVQQVQYEVDRIFGALQQFYAVNCYGTTNPNANPPTPSLVAGALNPNAVPAPSTRFPISIVTQLVTPGYLENQPNFNPLLDSSVGTRGYIAQFNRYDTDKRICIAGSSGSCTTEKSVGTGVIWKPQVAVLVRNVSAARQYMRLFNADCVSSAAGNVVLPCSVGTAGNYIVWERLPSLPTNSANSATWMSNPNVQDFTQMYTSYPSVYNLSRSGQLPGNKTQYFLCGG